MAPTVRQVHLSGFRTSEAWTLWTLCGMKREALLLKEDRVVSTVRASATLTDRTLCGEEVTWEDQIAGKVGTVYRSQAARSPGLVTCQRCAARMTLDALEEC